MKVGNLRTEDDGEWRHVAASVEWEDCERPAEEIYFKARGEAARWLRCDANAFLLASIVPALHYGERRLAIEGEVCPDLLAGASTAMAWLRQWYYRDRPVLALEAGIGGSASTSGERHAAFFFSGGVDSLATLGMNRLRVPQGHPLSITEGLLVYGLELDEPAAFDHVLAWMGRLAEGLDIRLIPVFTNIYLRFRAEDAANSFLFWRQRYEGAALSAVAHAFSSHLHTVSIGSTYDIPNMAPLGSHPLLDPNFSSRNLRIRHDGIELSRLEKTRLVADWPIARDYLRVCNQYKRYAQNQLNCGRCEKCVRTMLALLASGHLAECKSFASKEITPSLVRKSVSIKNGYGRACYSELVEPLRNIGRTDLSLAVAQKIEDYDGIGKPANGMRRMRRLFNRSMIAGITLKRRFST